MLRPASRGRARGPSAGPQAGARRVARPALAPASPPAEQPRVRLRALSARVIGEPSTRRVRHSHTRPDVADPPRAASCPRYLLCALSVDWVSLASARFAIAPPRPRRPPLLGPRSRCSRSGGRGLRGAVRPPLSRPGTPPNRSASALARAIHWALRWKPTRACAAGPRARSACEWAEVVQEREPRPGEHVYTVAAQTDTRRLLYLAVERRPRTPDGSLALGGYPAFVGAPAARPRRAAARICAKSQTRRSRRSSSARCATTSPARRRAGGRPHAGARVSLPRAAAEPRSRCNASTGRRTARSVLAVVAGAGRARRQYTLAYELDVVARQGRWEISAIQMDPDDVSDPDRRQGTPLYEARTLSAPGARALDVRVHRVGSRPGLRRRRRPRAPQRRRAAARRTGGSSLESAAAKAGETGRAVAMSLIGLAFAVAATVLAFRRDFKEAAGVFAVGIVAVLLATPAGVSLLRDTVASLFGASVIEIRSYRRGLRPRAAHLPRRPAAPEPGGVPVRGIVYFLARSLAGLVARPALPLARRSCRSVVPWYMRDLALPGASAALLDDDPRRGQAVSSGGAARSLRYRVGAAAPRRGCALRERPRHGAGARRRSCSCPTARTRGSAAALHGPGRCAGDRRARARASRRAPAASAWPRRAHVAISELAGSRPLTSAR